MKSIGLVCYIFYVTEYTNFHSHIIKKILLYINGIIKLANFDLFH